VKELLTTTEIARRTALQEIRNQAEPGGTELLIERTLHCPKSLSA